MKDKTPKTNLIKFDKLVPQIFIMEYHTYGYGDTPKGVRKSKYYKVQLDYDKTRDRELRWVVVVNGYHVCETSSKKKALHQAHLNILADTDWLLKA